MYKINANLDIPTLDESMEKKLVKDLDLAWTTAYYPSLAKRGVAVADLIDINYLITTVFDANNSITKRFMNCDLATAFAKLMAINLSMTITMPPLITSKSRP